MAEFRKLPTQQELQQILFMQGLRPQSTQDILQQNLQSQTIKPLPENVFQKIAGGARRAGQIVNQAGTAADVAKLFPGYTGQSQVNIPTGFNFAPKQDPMGGVIPQGLQTQQMNVGQLLQAIKPADVLGISGAERAYTDIGQGKAPQPMDVVDTLALGAGGLAGTKGLLKATKGLPVGMSIQDVSKASEFVPNVRTGEELIVQHNLSESNLRKADKLGALPVPSLGVAKTSAPFEKFGEITLIAPKEFAVPSKANPVFSADAYTKRFPSVTYQFDKKADKALKDIINPTIEKMPQGFSYTELVDRYDWKDRDMSSILKSKFLDEKGILPSKQEFPKRWDFEGQVDDLIRQNPQEYQQWLESFDDRLASVGAVPKEKIYKGLTYSGNRIYREATLENIVKEMKGGAGEEGWNYGVGSLRAAVTPKFKKFQDVQASRGLLAGEQEISKIKDVTDKAYSDLLSRMSQLNNRYDASDALLEVAQTKDMRALDRIYGEVPNELKADIKVFLDKFKNMPTEYFEIKPQRAVGIEEFAGAIIPKSASKKTREILEKRGIKNVYEYKTKEERADLMKKFGNQMFSAAPVGGIGLLGSQEEQQ
jgi:hypothetical protein